MGYRKQDYQKSLDCLSNVLKIDPNSAVNHNNLGIMLHKLGRFEEATQSLDSAITRFMDYPERANLIYRAGFIGWEYLKDIDVAKRYYNQFLEEYPNDEKASEVKQILTSGMLEMSDEDILNMLKGKAQ